MATNNYSYDPKNGWKYKPPKGIDDMGFLLLAFWVGLVVIIITMI